MATNLPTLPIKLVAIVFLCMVTISPPGCDAEDLCETISKELLQCDSYILKNAPTPGTKCCQVVTSLFRECQSSQTCRKICECVQKEISLLNNDQIERAGKLAKSCGAPTAFPIKRDMSC